MNLKEKLSTIQNEFKSKKSRYNSFGKYNFRSAEDILEALKPYNKNIAIKTKTNITATVPHKTNLVKLFQVFLWFSLSIKIIFVLL